MACHADQSIQLIKNIDQKVFNVLSKFKFSKNIITLHSCDKYMPKIKSLWSSWNYFSNYKPSNKRSDEPVQMTYWMNLLQNINKNLPLFITLNAAKNSIEEKYIFKEIYYEHPILDNGALMGQSQLETIQGKGNIWHAGAWMRYGFHEDGIIAGLKIAEKFGCKCPWPIKYNDDKNIL
jgi:predicted NAD/FAD-binding protein